MKGLRYQYSKVTTPSLNEKGRGVVLLLSLLFLLISCSPSIPTSFTEVSREPVVSPDNSGATLPPNIAPLNFRIEEDATDFVTRLHSERGGELIVAGKDVDIDVDDWHTLLDQTRGDSLVADIYIKVNGSWQHFRPIRFFVAKEDIDPYITYRLIRPSYVTYEELTINERSLESFDERVIYENMRFEDSDQGQCINCHLPRNWNQQQESQFHVRQAFGGTVFMHGNQATKINLKTDSTLSAGVYPAWHPKLNLIAYSVNETGQVFHTLDPQKVEVIDYASDLILYDLDANTVQHIDRSASEFESFPAWSPDGRTLYYISAHYTPRADDIDADLDTYYDQLHYNIYARDFDLVSRRVGPRRLVFDAEALGKSASVPRVSPDGKYLLFTLADYGQFHIWHKSADLWLLPLDSAGQAPLPSTSNGTRAYQHWYEEIPLVVHDSTTCGTAAHPMTLAHPLLDVNSPEAESYHAWSSNGRWILFSSRRDDGNYTRLYISYFDENGQAHKPFLLPQRSADIDEELLRSYNAAEFLVQPVQPSQRQLRKVIKTDARPASYAGSALARPEADTTRMMRPQPTGERRGQAVGY